MAIDTLAKGLIGGPTLIGGESGDKIGLESMSLSAESAAAAPTATLTESATVSDVQTSTVDVRDGSKGVGV